MQRLERWTAFDPSAGQFTLAVARLPQLLNKTAFLVLGECPEHLPFRQSYSDDDHCRS